jgi:hypothetical protein
MRVRFHPDAQHELAEAAVWYEQPVRVSARAAAHVRDAAACIASNPAVWPCWPELLQ